MNISFIFIGISLVSINTYLGESTMLSLSSYYEQKEMKFWSNGTGLARLFGTGFYLIMKYWIEIKFIFIINLILYLIIYSLSLYLLNYRTKIKLSTLSKSGGDSTSSETQDHVQLEDIQNIPSLNDLSEIDSNGRYVTNDPPSLTHKNLIFDIQPLVLGYFTSYLLGFAFIPLLVKTDFEYQLSQFITSSCIFLGRTLGNYIPKNLFGPSPVLSSSQKIRLFCMIHLYNFICVIFFSIMIQLNMDIPYLVTNGILVITYLINGICYPIVYNHIYQNYRKDLEWYMGAVGQYTSASTILGCLIGYPLQLIWTKNN
jgi:hypothetical protein